MLSSAENIVSGKLVCWKHAPRATDEAVVKPSLCYLILDREMIVTMTLQKGFANTWGNSSSSTASPPSELSSGLPCMFALKRCVACPSQKDEEPEE